MKSSSSSSKDTLPLGVGFVAYAPSVSHFAETAVPVLESYRPAAVWLFAPAPDQPGTIGDMIRALRASSSSSPGEWNDQVKVAVQVGSVAAAREAVEYGADIVVAQGVDAGGHQWARGASVLSLVPEIADMVSSSTASSGREVAVWAAGGLADGRGVAASLVLGAEAAVLGTKVRWLSRLFLDWFWVRLELTLPCFFRVRSSWSLLRQTRKSSRGRLSSLHQMAA